ncbi:MAG TPA: hypothetical protein P5086_07905 [Prolixibacteraceae bacterium]|nr:hypothetical protein [Prolixibacteraceae bacterium]HRV89220.1 hypothetical protein [Prolixibacteraceae bacterium]
MNTPFWPNNRTLAVFVICLVIATALWFLNALSKNYTTTIAHPVQYTNLPRNKFIINNPPEKLNLKISAHGFALLRYKMGTSFSPLTIDVEELTGNTPQVTGGLYIISTQNLRSDIAAQINPELQLVDISPGVFTISFDSLEVRQVPVAPGGQFQFKAGFGLSSPIVFTPSRVTISGPLQAIEATDTIYTIPRHYKNLESSFELEIPLVIPDQLIVEPGKVHMSVPVDEFTEKTMRVPVWIDNQPEEARVRLFPGDVEVTFRVALSRYARIRPEDISLFVSWEEIEAKLPQLPVRVQKLTPGITALKINPSHVEYLIEKP